METPVVDKRTPNEIMIVALNVLINSSFCSTLELAEQLVTTYSIKKKVATIAKKIDYVKEFRSGTPWMVSNSGTYWFFRYACEYVQTANNKFYAFYKGKKEASSKEGKRRITSSPLAFRFARRLTKEEEIKHLGNTVEPDKYKYTHRYFEMPSDALRAFENRVELYILDGNNKYKQGDLFTVVGNHMNLFTRVEIQEKAIDYEKEFVIDTPWMVSDDDIDEHFAYALTYSKNNQPYQFRAFYNSHTSIDAYKVDDWKFARHLTKEEEIEYLGVK